MRRQRRTGLLLDAHAVRPARRCDRDITRESARAALELRESNGDERTAFWNLIEIRNALSLGKVMPEEPFLSGEFGSGIVGIQGLVSMHENMPIQVQIL